MPTYDSEKIDQAWHQAELISLASSNAPLDPKLLETLDGNSSLNKLLASLQNLPKEHETFYIFIYILARDCNIEIDKVKIQRFLVLFEKVENAVKFVKNFLNKVNAHLPLELLFEIQAPFPRTNEQITLIRQLSKDPDIACSDQYRNKFKKIVLWIKEIDNYIKNTANAKTVKTRPTTTGNLIDWYYNIANLVNSSALGLSVTETNFLSDQNVSPKEIEAYKELKKLPAKDKKINDAMLPNIVVSGHGYFICKLSNDDVRGPFLGVLTGCCQHLGGAGAEAAEYGYTKDNACFYVMFKGKPPKDSQIDTKTMMKSRSIIAQCLAWRNPYEGVLPFDSNNGGTIVFDSIEMDAIDSVKRQRQVKALFFELAKNLVENSGGEIQRVMVGARGAGGVTFGIDNTYLGLENTSIPEDLGYTDAKEQNLGYSADFEELLKYFVDAEDQELDAKAALSECNANNIKFSAILCAGIDAKATKAIEFSLKCLDDINIKNETGETALMHACSKGNPEVVNAIFDRLSRAQVSKEELLEVVKAKDKDGKTALMQAWDEGNPEVVNAIFDRLSRAQVSKEELLELVNAKDKDGRTALMYAAYSNLQCINAIFDGLSKAEVSKEQLLEVVSAADDNGESSLINATPIIEKAISDRLSQAGIDNYQRSDRTRPGL